MKGIYFWLNLFWYHTSMGPPRAWVFTRSSSLLGPEPKFLYTRPIRLTYHLSSSSFLWPLFAYLLSLSHNLQVKKSPRGKCHNEHQVDFLRLPFTLGWWPLTSWFPWLDSNAFKQISKVYFVLLFSSWWDGSATS